MTMYIWIIVSVFIISRWYVQESHGEPCPPNVQIIHVCIDNQLNDLTKVYVSTEKTPLQQAIECTCTVTPSVSSDNYSLYVQGASPHHDNTTMFTFAFNDVVMKDKDSFGFYTKTNLTGETVLKYTSPNDDTVEVCVLIAAITDQDNFNIECMENLIDNPTDKTTIPTTRTSKADSTAVTTQTSKKDISIKTEPLTLSISNSNHDTKSSTESTDMSTKSQTNNDDNNEDNTILFAAAAGGSGSVALIIIVVIVIVCCKRKRKSPPNEATSNEATSRADTRPTSFCDGSDDDDYGMVLNPSYQPFHEVLPNQLPANTDTVETDLTTGETSTSAPVYATPLKRKVSQDTENDINTTVPSNDNTKKSATCQSGDANNPSSNYDYPRRHAAQVVTSDIDDTYDHTFTSASGKWTGNEYNRVPIRRNEDSNVPDNDTYNVLKL